MYSESMPKILNMTMVEKYVSALVVKTDMVILLTIDV